METKRKILLFSALHVIQVKQSNSVLHHGPTTAGDIRYVKRRFTQKEGEVFMPRPNQLNLQLPPTEYSVNCDMPHATAILPKRGISSDITHCRSAMLSACMYLFSIITTMALKQYSRPNLITTIIIFVDLRIIPCKTTICIGTCHALRVEN